MMVLNILAFAVGKCQAFLGAASCLTLAPFIQFLHADKHRAQVSQELLLIEGFGCGCVSRYVGLITAPDFF